MKKIFLFIVACMLSFTVANAQYGPTKFTDNVTVEIRGGVSTSMTDFYKGVSPVVGVGVEKYVTPWLGFAIDANSEQVLCPHPIPANNTGSKNLRVPL